MARGVHAETKQRVADLRRKIRHHDYLYYVKNRPKLSDADYDHLVQELASLEEKFPDLVTPDSPTQRVGAQPVEDFRTIKHTAPLLSLEATQQEEDIRRFAERAQRVCRETDYVLEEKFDGLSVELVYRHGALDQASTRGDAHKGEGVTANVKTIPSVPSRSAITISSPRRWRMARASVKVIPLQRAKSAAEAGA